MPQIDPEIVEKTKTFNCLSFSMQILYIFLEIPLLYPTQETTKEPAMH